MQIEKNVVVSFRYIMRNGRGDVLENSMDGPSTSYLHGSEGIQQLLQTQLAGLVTGDEKTVFLFRSSGLTDDDFTFEVIIDEVRIALPEELVLGYPVLLVDERCEADCDCYQNNISVNF